MENNFEINDLRNNKKNLMEHEILEESYESDEIDQIDTKDCHYREDMNVFLIKNTKLYEFDFLRSVWPALKELGFTYKSGNYFIPEKYRHISFENFRFDTSWELISFLDGSGIRSHTTHRMTRQSLAEETLKSTLKSSNTSIDETKTLREKVLRQIFQTQMRYERNEFVRENYNLNKFSFNDQLWPILNDQFSFILHENCYVIPKTFGKGILSHEKFTDSASLVEYLNCNEEEKKAQHSTSFSEKISTLLEQISLNKKEKEINIRKLDETFTLIQKLMEFSSDDKQKELLTKSKLIIEECIQKDIFLSQEEEEQLENIPKIRNSIEKSMLTKLKISILKRLYWRKYSKKEISLHPETSTKPTRKKEKPKPRKLKVKNVNKSLTYENFDVPFPNIYEKEYINNFDWWHFLLQTNSSLLCLGQGSKREILNHFADYIEKQDHALIVILDGFDSLITLEGILETFLFDVLGESSYEDSHIKTKLDEARYIVNRLNEQSMVIYFILHNLDGKNLRFKEVQASLAVLASCSKIRFITSIDVMNAQYFYCGDTFWLHQFNFSEIDLHTFRSHVEENKHDISELSTQLKNTKSRKLFANRQNVNADSISRILSSLSQRHVDITKELADMLLKQMEQDERSKQKRVQTEAGIKFSDYVNQCIKARHLSRSKQMDETLQELTSHGIMLRWTSSSTEVELIGMPTLNKDLLAYVASFDKTNAMEEYWKMDEEVI